MDYWPVALVAGVGLLLVLGLAELRDAQLAQAQRSRAQTILAALSSRAEVAALATFSPVLSMAAVVRVDGDITATRFNALAQQMLSADLHLRSITVAPDDVVRMVYPLAGNEVIQGRDYRDIPEQYASVLAARQLATPMLWAPQQMLKGFEGIVLRVPVFVPSSPQEAPRYWGMVSGLMELGPFTHLVGMDRADLPVDTALYEARADGRPGRAIWGDENVAARRPLLQTLNLPGGRWVLAVVPKTGWETGLAWQAPEVLVALLSLLLLTLGTAALTRKRLQLRERNASLQEEIFKGRQTLAELRRSQARLTSVAALGSDTLWEQDAKFRFTYLSSVHNARESALIKEVIGKCRWEVPGPADTDWTEHRALLERHEPFRDFEYSLYTSRGLQHISISGVPVFDEQGRFEGYRGIGRDVTERVQHESAMQVLQASQAQALTRLQAVLDAAVEVAIIALDLEGRITLYNEGAQRMLLYTEAQMLGQSPTLLHLHSELESRADALEAELDERPQGFEVLVARARRGGLETQTWSWIRQDGMQVTISLTVSRISSRSGELLGFLGVGRDVSAQLQAEAQLRDMNALLETRVSLRTAELGAARNHLQHALEDLLRAEKMAALGSLVAGVAHELNSPLGNCVTTASALEGRVRGALSALEDGSLRRSSLLSFMQDVSSSADILLRSLQHADEMVQHFKQMSADQASTRRRTFELAATVEDVLSVLRSRLRTAPLRVETDIHVSHELDSFPGPLGQIISNLVQNALLHAIGDKPRCLLLIRARELDADSLELIVEDDGVGMSEEVRRRAFEPFYTTKLNQGGTGLGLNIVRDLATGVLGGEITLESQPGQGCRFIFKLPFVAPHGTGRTPIHVATDQAES